jgi:hypothetical protein
VSASTNKLMALLEALDTEAAAIQQAASTGHLTTDEAVSLGALLVLIEKRANKALGPLKTNLREAAVAKDGGEPGPYKFQAPDGSRCTVVIPTPVVKVRKDINMDRIKAMLGNRFTLYFTEKITYSPVKTFTKTAMANPQQSKPAMDAVDVTEGTPRVSFKG